MNTIDKTYKTSEVAKIIGIHTNTVRKYEDLGLISKPLRKDNGYRVFTDLHIDQLRLARIAFQIEILQNGLRKKIVSIVKMTALLDFDNALRQTDEYINSVQNEIVNANNAVKLVEELLQGCYKENTYSLKRKEVSTMLGISMDTIRNWEMNGLLEIKRKENGYRIYRDKDIQRLKIIRSLKCANYSLEAILRMMNELTRNTETDIQAILNTPNENDDIISVCDRLILSLNSAKKNAEIMKSMLLEMKYKFSNPPL